MKTKLENKVDERFTNETVARRGIFVIACTNQPRHLTINGSILYSLVTAIATWQATFDKKLARERPVYQENRESISGMIPMPAAKDRSHS